MKFSIHTNRSHTELAQDGHESTRLPLTWHELVAEPDFHPIEHDDASSACVLVRYHYGREHGESPYNFVHGYWDMGSFVRFISPEELARRELVAHMHGEKYVLQDDHELWSSENGLRRRACEAVQKRFEALMALDLFSVPITP